MRFVVMGDEAYRKIASMCIETIKHHHPNSSVAQLTDLTTERFYGADEVWRCEGTKSNPWYTLDFMRVLGNMDSTPTAVVGGDTLICKPMEDVWEHDFDVALTWRDGDKEMPYNLGISFCRKPEFFAAVFERMNANENLKKWMGDQKAVAIEVAGGKWKVKELMCEEWNNSNLNEKKVPNARMLHYKGNRKQWMEMHYKKLVWCK